MKYLKFRQRTATTHLVTPSGKLFCGLPFPKEALHFDKQPSGRMCVYCRNRKKEIS